MSFNGPLITNLLLICYNSVTGNHKDRLTSLKLNHGVNGVVHGVLLESAYEECLHYELEKAGLNVIKQKPMPLIYEEKKLDLGYRIDLFVDGKVVIEVKSAEALNPVHLAQLMTYLKLSKCRIGLLINFNVQSLRDGIKRVIL